MGQRLMRTWYGVAAANLVLALLYALTGELALGIVNDTGLASPVWPSAGLAFAAVYQFGPRLLPGVAVGSFLNNAWAMHNAGDTADVTLAVAGAIAAGAALQAVIARVLVRRYVGHHPSLVGPRQVLLFLGLAGPLACVVNASVGLAAQVGFGIVQFNLFDVWTTWWVGDSIGVITVAPLVLMLLPEQREVWRERRLKVAVPTILAVTIAAGVFIQGAQLSRDRSDADLRSTGDLAAHTLKETLGVNFEILDGIRGLYLASDYVSREEFREYTTNALLHNRAIQALSWNPVLRAPEVASFVQRMRTQEDAAEYRLSEKDSAGAFRSVAARSRYVVVGYIEPLDRNRKALGYDIGSDPVRRAAIDMAIRTAQAAATAPIALVQDSGEQQGILMLLPIFPHAVAPSTPAARVDAVTGFAVGVYRMGDLLRGAFTADEWKAVNLSLTDVTHPEAPVLMAAQSSTRSGVLSPPVSQYVDAGGRTWRLDVTRVLSPNGSTQLVNEPLVMLLGLVIAMLLMAFLLLTTGLERQARREANIDPLTGLHNRRAMLMQLEHARRQAQIMRSSHVLLFMDLDRFKLVNDTGGHASGDQLLVQISEILQGAVRDRDTVARMGGDEFAILLLDCTEERGRTIGQEIITAVGGHEIVCRGESLAVGVSIGLTMIEPPDPDEVDELLIQADHASYAAKYAGGNQLIVHRDPVRGDN